MSSLQDSAKIKVQVGDIQRLYIGALRGLIGFRDDIRKAVLLGASALLLIFATSVGAAAQSWIQLAPSGTPPSARGWHGTPDVYDPGSDRMIVFGGGVPNTNDVWVLANANGLPGSGQWINLIPNGASGSPAARGGHSSVYDAATNRMIIFGGCLGGCFPIANDVWVLTNANGLGGTPTWQQLSPAGPSPAARTNFAAVYDQINNRMIVFGGQDGSGYGCSTYGDVWVLSNANGLGGTPTWSQLSPAGGPPAGQYGVAGLYDAATNKMMVFGGSGFVNGVCSDSNAAWVLSNANGLGGAPSWTNLTPEAAADSPGGRAFGAVVYSPGTNRLIAYGGGGNNGNIFGDVWTLTYANGVGGTPTWSQIFPSGTALSARVNPAGIFDTGSNRMTIFGGGNATGYLNDTWVLTNADGITNASGISLVSSSITGGAGDQTGLAVSISGGNIYVGGDPGEFVRFAVPPTTPTASSVLSGGYFFGMTSTGTTVYPVGGAVPPNCGASDGVGDTEGKSMVALYDASSAAFVNCQSTNFFPYRGGEGYNAAVNDGSNLYAAGSGETCGFGNYEFVLSKFDLIGSLISKVSDPGVNFSGPQCIRHSNAVGLTILNGNLYLAGYSDLSSEDGVDRPVLMRYTTALTRDWRVRPTDNSGGAFLGVTALGNYIYAVGYVGVSPNYDYLIEKYDEAGNRVWSKTSGGAGRDMLNAVIAIGGRLFAVGSTNSQGAGGLDAVLLEIDPATGDTLSTTTYGGAQDDVANAVATDGTDLYVVGGSRSFASAEGNSVGQSDIMLLRYSIHNQQIQQMNQTINFGSLSNKTFGDPDFSVSATASSGLPVSFTVGASDNCTISGNTVHITGPGSCTVTAHQPGDANYSAAPDVPQSFSIAKANQTITLTGVPSTANFGQGPFTLSASTTSGLAVALSAAGNCSLSSNSLSLTGVGSCTVTAAQGGNGNYNPAPTLNPSFPIGQAPTTTNAGVSPGTVQYSDYTTLTATVTPISAGGQSLTGSVQFYLNGTAVGSPAAINTSGVATLPQVQVNLAVGSYPVKAVFSSTNANFAGSNGTTSQIVTQENAFILYSGDTIAQVGTPLNLRATVWDSAAAGYPGVNPESGPTATLGDITKIWIAFDIYSAGTCGSGTPSTMYAQVALTGTPGIGTATTALSSSSEVSYCVVSRFVPGSTGGTNLFYAAPNAQAAGLDFYVNSGQFATGGGWVSDPTGSRGNFGFNARYNSSGLPKGQLVYVYRALYNGVLADFIIKSNALTALHFTGTTYPISSTLQGKASVQVNRASDGLSLFSAGNYTFSTTVTDSGQNGDAGKQFSLTVYANNGVPYHTVPSATPLQGGNVVVHLR
jgi:hypothetical protein